MSAESAAWIDERLPSKRINPQVLRNGSNDNRNPDIGLDLYINARPCARRLYVLREVLSQVQRLQSQ